MTYSRQQTAVPVVVQHMLRYGILGGLFFGLIGQFAFRYLLEVAILSQPQLSVRYTMSALAMAVIVLVAALGIILTMLGSHWRASGEASRYITGLAVGFGFGLATHTMFVGGLAGLLASRDATIYLRADYSSNEAASMNILLESLFRIFFEGYGITFTIVLVLTLAGALLASWLIPLAAKDSESIILKDAFGSLVVVLLPLLFIVLVLSNIILYACLPIAMHNIALDYNLPRLHYPIVELTALLPLFSIPITQIIAIIWVHRSRAENLHRVVLRLAQVLHILTAGIAILPFMNFATPGFTRSLFGTSMITLIMILAWLFALFAQWKLGEFKGKNDYRARVSYWSLMQATWGVVVLAWLLLDLFTARVLFNMGAYLKTLIFYANQSFTPIFEIVPIMLYEGLSDPVMMLGVYVGITCILATIVIRPVLWFFNLFER